MLEKITLLIIGILCTTIAISQTTIQGKISEKKSGEPVLFATLSLYKNDVLITGTESDYDGNYIFDNVTSGVYDIESSFVGFQSQRIVGIVVKDGRVNKVDIEMEQDSILIEEIDIVEYKIPLIAFNNTTRGKSLISKRKKPKTIAHSMDMAMSAAPMSHSTTAFGSSASPIYTSLPSAGQITAGEWNDLNNWEDWKSLIAEEDYKSMQIHWDIHPDERYSVFLTNKENYPIVNAKVDLLSTDNKIIWTTKSDNTGKAELWNTINYEKQKIKSIRISEGGIVKSIDHPKTVDQGSNHIKLNIACRENLSVDIAFIVDATGSMGDEIRFLTSELADIISRLENVNHKISYRTSAVFYRDHNEEYLTETSALTENINTTLDFIKTKSAAGGGDYEEALEEGIKEALALDWNPKAVARLAFLVLDAPPHYTPEIVEKLKKQVTTAAAQGIKLIPITASGINRETEFLMKYLSIITNGTYIFITDDSGIGDGHLTPVVENFEVEKLNDLIVRLIENYGSLESCNKEDKSNLVNINIYPNPASEQINIELDQDADRLILRSSSGKIILQIQDPKKGNNKIRLDNIIGGMYTVQVEKENKIIVSKSVIVIN